MAKKKVVHFLGDMKNPACCKEVNCGTGSRAEVTVLVSDVTCGNCKRTAAFKKAFAAISLPSEIKVANIVTGFSFACAVCGNITMMKKKPLFGDEVKCDKCGTSHTVTA